MVCLHYKNGERPLQECRNPYFKPNFNILSSGFSFAETLFLYVLHVKFRYPVYNYKNGAKSVSFPLFYAGFIILAVRYKNEGTFTRMERGVHHSCNLVIILVMLQI